MTDILIICQLHSFAMGEWHVLTSLCSKPSIFCVSTSGCWKVTCFVFIHSYYLHVRGCPSFHFGRGVLLEHWNFEEFPCRYQISKKKVLVDLIFNWNFTKLHQVYIKFFICDAICKTRWMSQNAKLSFWSQSKAKSELFPELFKFCLHDIYIQSYD